LRRLSNLETMIIVRLNEGSISLIVSSHSEDLHSTLLCWRNKRRRWGGLAIDFTIDRISSGVASGSPFIGYSRHWITSNS